MRCPVLFITTALAAALLSSASAGAQRGGGRAVELTLAQVVDSARLTAAVRQLPGLPASGASVYVVAYDSTGVVEDVFALGNASPADSAVAAVIRGMATPQLERRRYRWLLVRTQWGAAPVLATYHPRKEREPVLQNRMVIAREMSEVGARFGMSLRPQGELLEVRMRLDEAGSPIAIMPSRSSGLPDLDRAVLDVARKARFRPAMIDDIPVKVWVTLPITILPAPQPEPRLSQP